MRSPAADRSLRRLVARLAAADADDVRQVLDALDPAQQAEVRALLEAYASPTVVPLAPAMTHEPEPAPRDTSHLAGLSPWLAARAAAADDGGAGDAGRMTPGARQALAEIVRAVPAEGALASETALRPRRSFNPFRRLGRKSWA